MIGIFKRSSPEERQDREDQKRKELEQIVALHDALILLTLYPNDQKAKDLILLFFEVYKIDTYTYNGITARIDNNRELQIIDHW